MPGPMTSHTAPRIAAVLLSGALAGCQATGSGSPSQSGESTAPGGPDATVPIVTGSVPPSVGPSSADRVDAPVRIRIPLPNVDPYAPQAPFDGELAVAGGAIWVERSLHPPILLRVDPVADRITATIPLDYPVALVVGDDGTLWAIGPYGGAPGPAFYTLSRIDLATGALDPVVRLPTWEVAIGLGSIWASTEAQLLRIDPATGRTLGTRDVMLGRPQVACGALWGESPVDDMTLKRVDPETGVVARYGGSGPLYELPDGCWRWVHDGIERIWPLPTTTIGPSSQLVRWDGSGFWFRPHGSFQRWDPVAGAGVGTTWLLDPSDISPIAKIGDDGVVLAAGGRVWLVNGWELVGFDIASEPS
jgi:hypothetical protein